jgi:hypothetical protein
MAKKHDGVLYRLTFKLRFYDKDWGELHDLALDTTSPDVVALHLRRWREAQLAKLTEENPPRNHYLDVQEASLELTYGT